MMDQMLNTVTIVWILKKIALDISAGLGNMDYMSMAEDVKQSNQGKTQQLSRRELVLLDPLSASNRSDSERKERRDSTISDWLKGQLGFGS